MSLFHTFLMLKICLSLQNCEVLQFCQKVFGGDGVILFLLFSSMSHISDFLNSVWMVQLKNIFEVTFYLYFHSSDLSNLCISTQSKTFGCTICFIAFFREK